MRSSVSFMLSHGSGEPAMSHPDYEQHAHHHGALLVLVRGIGPSKPRSLQKIFERLQRVNNVKVNDTNGLVRDIWVRFVQEHPVENNDWGDFQTHRRLLGLITVGKFDTQTELNELCRVHESLKVKYTNTLFDSRCILFGGATAKRPASASSGAARNRQSPDVHETSSMPPDSLNSNASSTAASEPNSLGSSSNRTSTSHIAASAAGPNSFDSSHHSCNSNGTSDGTSSDAAVPQSPVKPLADTAFCTPSNFKSQAHFYPENDACADLEANVDEFVHSLFWILESKRLERQREKVDRVVLLQAPFEKKDFVGLDLDTRNNRKRCMGRITKNLADLTLQAGLVADSLTLFHAASETLRAISDSLWLGAAAEGLCAASAILLYPESRRAAQLQRNASLPAGDATAQSLTRALQKAQQPPPVICAPAKTPVTLAEPTADSLAATHVCSPLASQSSSTSSVSSMLLSSGSSSSSSSSNSNAATSPSNPPANPVNILHADEIAARYREAIINYSKYRHAGIIETEAALKAARICIAQQRNLDVAMFLQNVLYINLNMSETERVHRFETLTLMYQEIGYHRKAAFCQRLAAWRHVAQSNANPDWAQSYRLMLDSFGGHRLALDPLEVLRQDAGWPCLQIDLLQQLVFAAKRLGQSALATRHMTYLLQTQWRHLSATEQRELAVQLQTLSAQCEGAPVPLVLESGRVIPPANLTDVPLCELFVVRELAAHLRPHKVLRDKVEASPFLFTPIHFNSTTDRRRGASGARKGPPDAQVDFQWVQNDLCEVQVRLRNPLPFEMHIGDMRLLTTGVVFESLPETICLPPNGVPTLVTLHGTAIEPGRLEIQGYSTHALGVKSNCRLRAMQPHAAVSPFPPHFAVNVIPALPTLRLQTSLPQTATFAATMTTAADGGGGSIVVTTATLTICNGERAECVITLHNTSAVPITYVDESLQSALEARQLARIFRWSRDELQTKLPIAPQQSIDVRVEIYADADFLGALVHGAGANHGALSSMGANSSSLGNGQQTLQQQQQLHTGHGDGPASLSAMSASGHASLPSRVSSPMNTLHRRTELSSSFRSTQSGHSSLATISLGAAAAGSSAVRHLEVQFRFRYAGGAGERDGYCRQCAVAFNLEFMPSAQVTNWDVLPAEIPSQFYLVLDVINLTAQEMTLQYTANKNIIIEARESCRVPVPVEKCPLEQLLAAESHAQSLQQQQQPADSLMTSSSDPRDLAERLCAEHIADQVQLSWTLAGTETQGVCSLRGITLSPGMMGLITVAPLQWELFVNEAPVPPQAEVTCAAGQQVLVGVRISNLSPTVLADLQLTIQFYQDYQNGLQNYKLETRVVLSGPDHVTIPQLGRNASAFHECSAIFFTPGRFKANIQCVSQQPTATAARRPLQHHNNTGAAATHPYSSAYLAGSSAYAHYGSGPQHPLAIALSTRQRGAIDGSADVQVWRFIPPLDITVTE